MQQRIQEYIKDHREHLDVETPPEQLWNKINHQLERKSRPLWTARTLWKIAAAILVLVLTSVLLLNFRDSMGGGMDAGVADLTTTNVEMPYSKDDWRKAEKEYLSQINVLLEEIQEYPVEDDMKAQEILLKVSEINFELMEHKRRTRPLRYDSGKAQQMLGLYKSKVEHLKELRDHLQQR